MGQFSVLPQFLCRSRRVGTRRAEQRWGNGEIRVTGEGVIIAASVFLETVEKGSLLTRVASPPISTLHRFWTKNGVFGNCASLVRVPLRGLDLDGYRQD
jgi:hypothetical protein